MRRSDRRVAGEPSPASEADFDRWLADGLAPDDHDRAAGQLLAASWRDRRRALDAAARRPSALARWRAYRWWAPVAVVAIAAVAAVAWPTPVVVDEGMLAGAYLDSRGTLPSGAP